MKTIVAGSRGFRDPRFLTDALKYCGWVPTEIHTGSAPDAVGLAKPWADAHGVPFFPVNAHWKVFENAGYLRDIFMVAHADALIAIWDGKSGGTTRLIDMAIKAKLRVFIYPVQMGRQNAQEAKLATLPQPSIMARPRPVGPKERHTGGARA